MAIMHVTKNNFQEEVIQSDQPVLLDFWANWCGPCRMVGPVMEEIARERPDVKVGKIDVDEQRELAAAFQIMSIPTLVVMQDGKVTQQVVGLRPKEQILAMLDRGN
ncbi:thioredoxin [Pusillibacter faecalis]|uniref:thioredoxin n=1 Tax=Pusillibacter faecalis TaxID=2714358 RepID=UPI0021086862|nr:thioredoxin [Pusillibacter faecalis]MBS5658782.1 thioredoxin [Oscillibacter sp.]MCQ5027433.1 thioredoxin [Oscillibacter valericigenes]